MTAATHPLFGEVLEASGFKRWDGALLLVVTLPDGSPGTIRVAATNVFSADPVEPVRLVLDGEGIRALYALAVPPRADSRRSGK